MTDANISAMKILKKVVLSIIAGSFIGVLSSYIGLVESIYSYFDVRKEENFTFLVKGAAHGPSNQTPTLGVLPTGNSAPLDPGCWDLKFKSKITTTIGNDYFRTEFSLANLSADGVEIAEGNNGDHSAREYSYPISGHKFINAEDGAKIEVRGSRAGNVNQNEDILVEVNLVPVSPDRCLLH